MAGEKTLLALVSGKTWSITSFDVRKSHHWPHTPELGRRRRLHALEAQRERRAHILLRDLNGRKFEEGTGEREAVVVVHATRNQLLRKARACEQRCSVFGVNAKQGEDEKRSADSENRTKNRHLVLAQSDSNFENA